MKEDINNGKSRIGYTESGVEIAIPSKKNIFMIIFFTAWLGGWVFGEIMVGALLFNGAVMPFLVFWLVGWTAGGVMAITIYFWMLFGKEVIILENNTLTIEKRVLMLKRRKEYDLDHINGYRLEEGSVSIFSRRNSLEFYGLAGGRIQFDYGMKTIKFGASIDEAEARYLIEDVLSVHRY